jgi:hypothetical protein
MVVPFSPSASNMACLPRRSGAPRCSYRVASWKGAPTRLGPPTPCPALHNPRSSGHIHAPRTLETVHPGACGAITMPLDDGSLVAVLSPLSTQYGLNSSGAQGSKANLKTGQFRSMCGRWLPRQVLTGFRWKLVPRAKEDSARRGLILALPCTAFEDACLVVDRVGCLHRFGTGNLKRPVPASSMARTPLALADGPATLTAVPLPPALGWAWRSPGSPG